MKCITAVQKGFKSTGDGKTVARNPKAKLYVNFADFSLRRLCLPVQRRDEVAEAVARLGSRHRDLVTISWST